MNSILLNATSQACSDSDLNLSPMAAAAFMSGANKTAKPLGILPNFAATSKPWDFQKFFIEGIDPSSGEIATYRQSKDGLKHEISIQNFCSEKFDLMKTNRKVLPSQFLFDGKTKKFRVVDCHRRVLSVAHGVDVYKTKKDSVCHYKGLFTCGSIWVCPVCASRIANKKQKIISSVIDRHIEAGGDVILVTLTIPHSLHDSLDDLLQRFKSADDGFHKSRKINQVKYAIGFIESIKSLEITYSQVDGWHPHYHQLWFVKKDTDIEKLKYALHHEWKNYCLKRGLREPSVSRGVDIRRGHKSSYYVTKMGWNLSSEMVYGHLKSGRNSSFTPFELLDLYSHTGESWISSKYLEYAKATHGRHFTSRFPKLQKLYNVVDKTDEELANEANEPSFYLGNIEYDLWRLIVKNDLESFLLRLTVNLTLEKSLKIIRSYFVRPS